MWEIFHKTLSVPHNVTMNINNVMLRECDKVWYSFWAPLKYFRKVHKIQIIFRAARKNYIWNPCITSNVFVTLSTYRSLGPTEIGAIMLMSMLRSPSLTAAVAAKQALSPASPSPELRRRRHLRASSPSPSQLHTTTTTSTTTYIHPYSYFTHLHTIWKRRRSSSELTESCSSDFGGVLSEQQLWRGLRL